VPVSAFLALHERNRDALRPRPLGDRGMARASERIAANAP